MTNFYFLKVINFWTPPPLSSERVISRLLSIEYWASDSGCSVYLCVQGISQSLRISLSLVFSLISEQYTKNYRYRTVVLFFKKNYCELLFLMKRNWKKFHEGKRHLWKRKKTFVHGIHKGYNIYRPTDIQYFISFDFNSWYWWITIRG